MNFCLRSRLPFSYLENKKVKEIRVDYKDLDSIPGVYHKFNKQIILFPPLENEPYDWNKINQFSAICKNNLIVSCLTLEDANTAKKLNIRFMLAMEAHSGFELQGMEQLGAEYAYVGMPLFFNLPSIKKQYKIKLRAIPTVSYNHHLPHGDSACGQWIRPEDLHRYEDLIDVIEFEFCDIPREETLFKVYAIDEEWNTRLDILIDDLESSALNRFINPTIGEVRMVCGQRCLNGGVCHLCGTILKMAEEETIDKVKGIVSKKNRVSE